MMGKRNYTTAFAVEQTPEDVFKAINHVQGWRSTGGPPIAKGEIREAG